MNFAEEEHEEEEAEEEGQAEVQLTRRVRLEDNKSSKAWTKTNYTKTAESVT